MTLRADLDRTLAAELGRWPDVACRRERRGKHRALVLTVGEARRTLFYPCTPSDPRGVRNSLAQLRRTLRALGAAKAGA